MKKRGIIFASGVLLAIAAFVTLAPIMPPPPAAGGGVWGAITGTLSAQTDLQTALDLKQTAAQVQTIADAKVSDAAYDEATWDADTGHAPSKNSLRDKIEAVVASIPAVPSGGVIGTATATIAGGFIDPSTADGVIASWVRNGAGQYTVAFTVAQPDVNYIVHVTIEYASLAAVSVPAVTKTVNDFMVLINDVDDTPADPANIQITVSRLSQ